MIKIIPYSPIYLEEMTELFIKKYQNVVKKIPLLPNKYSMVEEIKPKIEKISSTYDTVVAVKDNHVVGYLSGFLIDSFKSSHSGIYTPEWSHATLNNDVNIFNEMYQRFFSIVSKKGCKAHAITILGDELELKENLNWNGHGLLVIDAIRKAQLINERNQNIKIRFACLDDIPKLINIIEENHGYMSGSPTFLHIDKGKNISEMLNTWLTDVKTKILIAFEKEKIIGMMKVVINSCNSATIVHDKKILKISTTHVLEAYQNQGIAKALLNEANRYALDNNLESVAVDFESTNFKARRFWLKHFDIVCYSLIRYIDDRILEIN
ncbi:GNAT family N-acetyltransferase [Mycoplasmatota bacterium]|nr:GNAT family N-acetyltransferase [Mycoplasmatota bacterium]